MISTRSTQALVALLAVAMLGTPMQAGAASAAPAKKPVPAPSRPAEKGCKWEKFNDASLPLDAWVQRCDFGDRKIDFVAMKNSLAQRYSDSSGDPDPVLDVFDLNAGESPEQGIRRLFDERTDKKLAAQCVLAQYHEQGTKTPVGIKRYTFLANKSLARSLKAKTPPGDIPEPPCGDWGDSADGIQYWEAQPSGGAREVMFVRVGQDTPLFDEATLRLK